MPEWLVDLGVIMFISGHFQTHQSTPGPEPARLQRLLLGVRVAGSYQDGEV